jgi:hypothetical protein
MFLTPTLRSLKLTFIVSNIILATLISVCQIGCQSLDSKAKTAYDKGEFLGAATMYEEMLKEGNNKAEAKQGLERSRQKIIQGELIKVRMARLAKNREGAYELFKKIIQQESIWGLAPEGQAFSTQKEELEELILWITLSTKSLIEQGYPLKAKLELDVLKRDLLLDNSDKNLLRLEATLAKEGKEHCQSFHKNSAGHYSTTFSNKYCQYWGLKEESNAKVATNKSSIPKISEIKMTGKIQGLPTELQSEVSQAVKLGLEQTPYFSIYGTNLPIEVDGTFTSFYLEEPTIQTHFYDVEIPYQAFETETYSENIPYTNYRSVVDPRTHLTSQEPYTDHRYESRTKQVAVTRHRTETRSLTFGAIEYNLRYQLQGRVIFKLDNTSFSIPVSEHLSLHDFYHDTNNEKVGLRAKPKNAPEVPQWIKEKLAIIPVKTAEALKFHWIARYCSTNPSTSKGSTSTEDILLCAVGTAIGSKESELPEKVNQWSKSQFGLDYATIQGAIGSVR